MLLVSAPVFFLIDISAFFVSFLLTKEIIQSGAICTFVITVDFSCRRSLIGDKIFITCDILYV